MQKTNPLTLHLRTVGESYGQHACIALRVGCLLMIGGLACFAHALFPFAFVTTGSGVIRRLYGEIEARARVTAAPRH